MAACDKPCSRVASNDSKLPRMNPLDDVAFGPPTAAMTRPLLAVARRIFTDTFSHRYDHDAFERFCDQAYAVDGPMARDLGDPDVDWQVAAVDAAPIGYAKLAPLRAPAQAARPGSLELQQIYVESGWHGTGVAERLMQWAVERAVQRAAPELYLTVFDHNQRAKRFYARHGFREVGRCTFTLGERVDDDRIWCRELVA